MAVRILIIEDNEVARGSLTSSLQAEGFDVTAVGLGTEGLVKARQIKPDLILLDLMLPDIDGYDLLKKMTAKDKSKRNKIVVLTNMSDQNTIAKIIKAGGRKYLVKSDYSLKEIVDKIKEFLKEKK